MYSNYKQDATLVVLEMKDKLIDLGEMDFLKWLEKTYKVDLGLKVEDV
tara:strand:- start:468 stop:611 length:144 start_codon:yes stop_codon:yes gene_type:complete